MSNPFAKANDPKAQDPNNLGGNYVSKGSHEFEITDVKLVNNERDAKMFHVWELKKVSSDNPDQADVCAFMPRIQPDPYLYGIKDSKAIASAVLNIPFEAVDQDILSGSTTDDGKKLFVGQRVKCTAVEAQTKSKTTIVKCKWEHVAEPAQAA